MCLTSNPEIDWIRIGSLNDLLFCERRAALHLNEQMWRENQYTLEGSFAHQRVDVEANASEVSNATSPVCGWSATAWG